VVKVVDARENAGAGADGGASGSEQGGEFAVDVPVVIGDGGQIVAARDDVRLVEMATLATTAVDDA